MTYSFTIKRKDPISVIVILDNAAFLHQSEECLMPYGKIYIFKPMRDRAVFFIVLFGQ